MSKSQKDPAQTMWIYRQIGGFSAYESHIFSRCDAIYILSGQNHVSNLRICVVFKAIIVRAQFLSGELLISYVKQYLCDTFRTKICCGKCFDETWPCNTLINRVYA